MKKLFGGMVRLYQQPFKISQVRLSTDPMLDYLNSVETLDTRTLTDGDARKLLQQMQIKATEVKKAYYLQKVHQALEVGNFEEAAKYLTADNLHSTVQYGDTPITLAISEKQWDFLRTALQYVEKKVACPEGLYSIINSEHDEQLQREMIGHAEHFYILNDPT